ncbi:hypothetical protein FHS31_001836 [Sphingomonas vulcanisoli]|uniref:PEP-CTERM sorting domain-containing protein n=1 Tax=Sphingomonas vulcanisoli TaxID=1658060 RepID=A0ABX0TU17_9SPHN|nr:PEPxxWA-CTERM sorting domain-containing protein [Sphingomonas vulcanisoli]NIJ08219.1 hypothetical protein [Sphingomonas vulcanisoli]
MNSISKFVTGMALVLAPAGAAEAVILYVVHSGTVASGVDVDGVFGMNGRDFSGLAYSITYSFDTEAPGAIEYSRAVADYYAYDQWNLTQSGASAVFTLDGIARSFSGSGYTDRETFNPDRYGVQALTQDEVAFEGGYIVSNVGSPDTIFYGTEDLTVPFALILDAAMLDGGNTNTNSDFRMGNTSLLLRETAMSADGGSAVPEPANWAMLIWGFGLVGAAMRHQRLVGVSIR